MKRIKKLIPAIIFVVIVLIYSIWTRILLQSEYEKAENYLRDSEYTQAYETFENVSYYSDSEEMAVKSKYLMALQYKKDGKYEEAAKLFSELGTYEDSMKQAEICKDKIENAKKDLYLQAVSLYEAGKYNEAAISFAALGDYEDSITMLRQSKEKEARISKAHTFDTCAGYAVGINNGKVVICGKYTGFDQNRWDKYDIVSVAAGGRVVAGLTVDGNVIIEDWSDNYDLKQAESWKNIIDITVGNEFVFAIDSDYKLYAAGRNLEGECNTGKWDSYKIVNVEAGWRHIAGLDENGKVHILEKTNLDGGHTMQEQIDAQPEKWDDIVDISTGGGEGKAIGGEFGHVVGLKSNGEVVAAGNNQEGQCDIPDDINWKNAKKIAAGDHHTVIVSSDNKVYSIGEDGTINYDGQPGYEKMGNWEEISCIEAGSHFTLAVDRSGKMYAAGYDHQNQDDARKWSNILLFEQ